MAALIARLVAAHIDQVNKPSSALGLIHKNLGCSATCAHPCSLGHNNFQKISGTHRLAGLANSNFIFVIAPHGEMA
jgi:hypothetical protein